MLHLIDRWERGQGLVEYALILVLIAIAVVGLLGVLGVSVRDALYQNIVNEIDAIIN